MGAAGSVGAVGAVGVVGAVGIVGAVGVVGAHFDDFIGFPVQSLLQCRLSEKFPSLGPVKYDTICHIWASSREREVSSAMGRPSIWTVEDICHPSSFLS